MAREAQLILETLDRHLRGPGSVRLLGGAALTLGYGLERATEGRHTSVGEVESLLPSVVVPAVFAESWPRASSVLSELLARLR